MDYEKKYKEALERAKKELDTCGSQDCDAAKQLFRLFPELKESEDEKTKRILHSISSKMSLHLCDIFTEEEFQCFDTWSNVWLEKQGEQNTVGKIGPKFHKGEWITNGDYTWKIVEIKPLDYILQSQDGNIVDDNISYVDEQFHSFTIEDAKDGDVLCYETEDELRIFIYKNGHIHYHCCYYNAHLTTIDSFFVVEKYLLCYIHPATKEQRELLFKKMKEAGYKWDAEKKELKKIEPFNKYEGLTDFERTLADICIGWIGEELGWKQYIKDNADVLLKIAVEKFKSVQDVPFEQKPNWNEDETSIVINNPDAYKIGFADGKANAKEEQWKPTKEQMDALLFVVQHYTPKVTDFLAWDSLKILELMYHEIKQ